jgi:hypothetical protein
MKRSVDGRDNGDWRLHGTTKQQSTIKYHGEENGGQQGPESGWLLCFVFGHGAQLAASNIEATMEERRDRRTTKTAETGDGAPE